MREFSFTNAWALGVRFFSGKAVDHVIILLVVGVLVPTVLAVATGASAAMANPAGAGGPSGMGDFTGMNGMAGAGIAAGLALAVGYLLQFSSYFASWRLGFGLRETLAGALGYGLLAGLATMLGTIAIFIVIGVVLSMISPVVTFFAIIVAMLALFATLFTTLAALMAVVVCVIFGLAIIFGAATGNMGAAATMAGGSGFVVVMLIVLSIIMLWVAGRLSCTTALLAERRSLNLFSAMAESWRLTWEDEWRIMRYLALVGLVLSFLMMLIAGAAMAVLTLALGESLNGNGLERQALTTLLGLPLAYLTVLIPAGIYRELAGAPMADAEVFA